MPRRLISAGESAPLREIASARRIRPSPERPYSKLRTASGHVRANASARRSTSSSRPVWRDWDFSAIVWRSSAAVMSVLSGEWVSGSARLKHLESLGVHVEGENFRTDRREILSGMIESLEVLALFDGLAVRGNEAIVDAKRGHVAIARAGNVVDPG